MLAVASVGMLFGQTGCGLFSGGSKEAMRPAAGNIAGEGTVEAKIGDNGNTEIEVRVKHLAAPEKVAADASVYVVWIRPSTGRIQNVGALEVDDELVGKFKTTTPHRAFRVTITPEPSARMAEPTHEPVFTSDVSLED